MRSLAIWAVLALILFGCRRTNIPQPDCHCQCVITDKKKDTAIVGCWKLVAINYYAAIGNMNNWQNVNANNRSIIQLFADSTFHSDSLFKWKDRHYDHFKTENGYTWLYSSNTAVPADGYSPDATVLLPAMDTLIITRFGIDAGEMEKFARYQ